MNPVHHFHAFTLFLLLITISIPAQSDWINLTGAEISPNIVEVYVMDDHVKVKLEVYVDDLQAFEQLIPDDWIEDADIERPSLEQRIEHFAKRSPIRSMSSGSKPRVSAAWCSILVPIPPKKVILSRS